MKLFRAAFLAALLATSALWAQIQTGRILGAITDPNKAVVPNARVSVTQEATGQAKSISSNEVGEFVVTPLDPGLYTVEVTAPGFQATQVKRVEVVISQSARVDVELRIG